MFRWFGNPCTEYVQSRMAWRYENRGGDFGCITTPKQGNALPPNVDLIGDNGRYGNGWKTFGYWVGWLEGMADIAHRFRFISAPDVFDSTAGRGDAKETLALGLVWLPVIRSFGFPAAFVSQENSHLPGMIPWDELDALFIGGGDTWKWGPEVIDLCREAKARGKWVHFGRVNGLGHCKAVMDRGGDSADGTKLVPGPDQNVGLVEWWLNTLNQQGELFPAFGQAA
ncbi:hypothetical protein [Amycolatopsis japonica]